MQQRRRRGQEWAETARPIGREAQGGGSEACFGDRAFRRSPCKCAATMLGRGPPPLKLVAPTNKSAIALFFRRRLGNRRQRSVAGGPGQQVVEDELVHRRAGVDRRRS